MKLHAVGLKIPGAFGSEAVSNIFIDEITIEYQEKCVTTPLESAADASRGLRKIPEFEYIQHSNA